MNRKLAGGEDNMAKRISKISPKLSVGNPRHECSPELFPSGVDLIEDTSEMNHFVSCSQSTSSSSRRCPTIGNNLSGTRCSALCPSARFNEDSNNVAVAVLNRVSDTMLTLFEKLSKRIDSNAVDVAKLVVEDRDRIRDLERRVQFIEDEQKKIMMTRRQVPDEAEPKVPAGRRDTPAATTKTSAATIKTPAATEAQGNTSSGTPKVPAAKRKAPAAKNQEVSAAKQKTRAAKQIIPAAKQIPLAAKPKAPPAKQKLPAAKKIIPAEKPKNPAIPLTEPVERTPKSQPPVVARGAGARTPRPCSHCGKVLSASYVNRHEKKCIQKR